MTTLLNYPPIPREQVVKAIETIRTEWEETNGNDSLIDLLGSIGLVLFDMTRFLEFTMDEQLVALGSDLYRDLEQAEIVQLDVLSRIDVIQPDEWVPERWSVAD